MKFTQILHLVDAPHILPQWVGLRGPLNVPSLAVAMPNDQLVGGWPTPLENMKVVNGKDDIPYIYIYEMENKRSLKPPTSDLLLVYHPTRAI